MADLSLDLNPLSPNYRDLLIIDNDLVLTSDANPIGTNNILQNILQRLSFMYGEWFMDLTQGIPYIQQIFVKNPDLSKIDAILQNCILGTPGVQQLTQYTFTPNFAARNLAVSFRCTTVSGPVNYNGLIAPIGPGALT